VELQKDKFGKQPDLLTSQEYMELKNLNYSPDGNDDNKVYVDDIFYILRDKNSETKLIKIL
jgi:hypothetical protein